MLFSKTLSATLETGGEAWASRGRGERAGAAAELLSGLLRGCCRGGIIVTIITMA